MNEKRLLRWGLLATGAIARRFATALQDPASAGVLTAAASRDLAKAEKFCEDFPGCVALGSYEALLAHEEVDAVYISTPHPMHAEWAVKAAEAGKHILCEKPLTLNHAEAMAVVEAARRHDVFLMEAFMYRCHPQMEKAVALIREGALGEVQMIDATFGFSAEFNPEGRLFSNELGGGGILDVGGYPMSLARRLAGAALGRPFAEPIRLEAVASLNAVTGTDEVATAVLDFGGGLLAHIACAVRASLENAVRVTGSKGTLVIPQPWTPRRGATALELKRGSETERMVMEVEADLYALEAATVARHLADRAAPAMSPADTLGNMAALDRWREAVGLQYAAEKLEAPVPTISRRPLSRRDPVEMRYGSLEGVDKKISRLVMGCDNQLALPHGSVMFDDFFERGGTAFDTAWLYARGQCERILGRWIENRDLREEVVLLVKGAHTPHCTPEGLTTQLLKSLDRLKTDYADVYMLHRDNPQVPVGEFVEVLNEHHAAGRIRAFGGSNWSLARLEAANRYAAEHGLQPMTALSDNFSLARMVDPVWGGCVSVSDSASRSWLAAHRLALFAWSSQARGFFTERGDPADTSDAEMVRCWHASDNFARRERAQELAAKRGVTPTAIALAYVLAQPFEVFALFGPRRIEETRTSFEGLSLELTPGEIRWLNLEADSAA